jgi:hypothetical protein
MNKDAKEQYLKMSKEDLLRDLLERIQIERETLIPKKQHNREYAHLSFADGWEKGLSRVEAFCNIRLKSTM